MFCCIVAVYTVRSCVSVPAIIYVAVKECDRENTNHYIWKLFCLFFARLFSDCLSPVCAQKGLSNVSCYISFITGSELPNVTMLNIPIYLYFVDHVNAIWAVPSFCFHKYFSVHCQNFTYWPRKYFLSTGKITFLSSSSFSTVLNIHFFWYQSMPSAFFFTDELLRELS